jgi:sugar transferase (PEP-CTERM system associated)
MIQLFRVFIPASVVGLLVSEIILAYCCYASAFYLLGDDDFVIYYVFEGGFERTALVVATLVLGIYFNDLYTELRVVSRLRMVQQMCLVLGLTFFGQALAGYISTDLILGRRHLILGSSFALVVLPLWRILFDHAVMRVFNKDRILFVGANRQVQQVMQGIQGKPQFGIVSMGYLSDTEDEQVPLEVGPRLGRIEDLERVCASDRPTRIVVGLSERRGQLPVNVLLQLRLSGLRVEEVASLYEVVKWRVSVEALRPSELLFDHPFGPNATNLMIQRVYSFLIALVGAAVTAPLMLLVWLAVRVTSRGPAIYRQPRVGLKGKVFNVLKFRSMYIDAEARTGAVWAQKNDPRITPLGYWLRKLRLDELPQFFNVLKGEMAMVGPRPERPEFVRVLSEQIPFYGERHSVLPGITGWAQINHKYGDTMEDTITKLEFDLYYLKHLGLSLDMYIAFHTVKVMLMQKGSQ